MRAPIPGRKPEETDQRAAMLRRLGIVEEKPRAPSRWDVLAGSLEPATPVQTPPPVVDEKPVEEPLPATQPIPMAEALRGFEAAAAEPVVEPPVIQAPPVEAPAPEPVAQAPVEPVTGPTAEMSGASFMPGWGEESIPEEEEAEAFDEPEAPVEAEAAPAHETRWMDEPLAEAPRREELLPKMDRPVGYAPASAGDSFANDEDLSIPPVTEPAVAAAPPVVEALAAAPVAEPTVARAPDPVAPPVMEAPVARQPVTTPPAAEPVVEAPVAREPVAPPPAPEPIVQAPVAPAPEPVVEAPVARQPGTPPPVIEPEPVVQKAASAPKPAPEPEAAAAPPVDTALQQMRAELEAMRKQFQTAPAAAPAAPIASAIPYDGRRSAKKQTDFFANARMVVWTLAIVAALWVTFHMLKVSAEHHPKQDHIMATVTGKEKAEAADAQNSDN